MAAPSIFNVAARSVDLTWEPPPYRRAAPGDPSKLLGALGVTGYVVSYREAEDRRADAVYSRPEDDALDAFASITLGNVTTTTVVGLLPDVRYVFAVAAVSEDRFTDRALVDSVDLYGRRALHRDHHVGPRSAWTNATATLRHDLSFKAFDANATVSHGPVDDRVGLGPSGLVGGEGHWGLVLVGSANVEHCNASHACCDDWDEHQFAQTGDGCRASAYACVETTARDSFVVEGEADPRRPPKNDPTFPRNATAAKRIAKISDFTPRTFALPLAPSARCGPAVRLTSRGGAATHWVILESLAWFRSNAREKSVVGEMPPLVEKYIERNTTERED